MYAVIFRKVNDNPKSPESSVPPEAKELFYEFKDVFSEELPAGIPLKRSVDPDIKLAPDAVPQKEMNIPNARGRTC